MRNQIWRFFKVGAAATLVLGVIVAQANVTPPTGERDLVVFIAKYKPNLYRLVGQQPRPYGPAQFYSPQAIVADPGRQCFYVLDQPKLITETTKIWRIGADGTPTLAFQGQGTTNNGPFGKPVSLGLDTDGRLLIADAVTGLWRLEANGSLQRLFDGRNKPLHKISAATGSKRGLILATSYLHTVTGGQMLNLPPRPLGGTGVGNSTGRQVPIRTWKNQGGLYQVNPPDKTPAIRPLVVNRAPGGAEHDTYWRTASQVFVDSAGRAVLVDAGSVSKRTEKVYTGSMRRTDHPQKRTTESVINGGLFVLHPNGRFENLTFKTPNESSGPMRRPHGAAQWSDDTYLVADPEMYVKGVTGTGGLLLLKLDGSRQARWPFGERLRPVAVAILRGSGTPAQATVAQAVRLSDVAGHRTAGKITRIESVSWERKPQGGGGSIMSSIGMNWEEQPKAQAEAKLRGMFENARWSIAPNGALRFSGARVNPQTEGNPAVMSGTVTQLEGMLSVSASYKTQSMFDTQLGSIDVRIHAAGAGQATMSIKTNIFTKTERLKATFEQTLSL